MNPEKVGKFIKSLRKKNHLTQKEFADKYGVTYQAVSKWENGINLPDISLIRQISKDFNIPLEDIFDGNVVSKKRNIKAIILTTIIMCLAIALTITVILQKENENKTFNFKTISTDCKDFNVSGIIAYDEEKSAIYISHIKYCGGNDETVYQKIECNLYEQSENKKIEVNQCASKENIKLEDYLKNIRLHVDNYSKVCKTYNNESLFLEINAAIKDNETLTYKIPLQLNNDCSYEK